MKFIPKIFTFFSDAQYPNEDYLLLVEYSYGHLVSVYLQISTFLYLVSKQKLFNYLITNCNYENI